MAADGEEGLIELLLYSKETVASLEARLVLILRRAERAKAKERLLTSGSHVAETQNSNSVKMKLPKLYFSTFNDNILQWQEFWDVYKTAVDEEDISNVTKFSYLKGSIRVAAATAIFITDENYPVAIKILQNKFGKKENITTLYS